jgi:NAD(P)H-dependent FMN reductase
MTTLVGISGSLRKGSFNTMLLEAAARSAPEGVAIEIASIRDIPLYDADVQEAGMPASVAALKERLAAADGLLVATPEYNHSIPGVAKNAVDWLSRPARDIPRVFGGLPVALMGATVGRGATLLGQEAWQPVLRALTTLPFWRHTLAIAEAGKLFGPEGLTDEETRGRVRHLVHEFAEFVAAHPRKRS